MIGVGEVATGVVGVKADRCALIAPTRKLMHPNFGGGEMLTGIVVDGDRD
jgi:hypothetical protein